MATKSDLESERKRKREERGMELDASAGGVWRVRAVSALGDMEYKMNRELPPEEQASARAPARCARGSALTACGPSLPPRRW